MGEPRASHREEIESGETKEMSRGPVNKYFIEVPGKNYSETIAIPSPNRNHNHRIRLSRYGLIVEYFNVYRNAWMYLYTKAW